MAPGIQQAELSAHGTWLSEFPGDSDWQWGPLLLPEL